MISNHFEHLRCGAMYRGVRCYERLYPGDIVCNRCVSRVVHDMYYSTGGRQILLNLIGEHTLREYREAALRDEQRAREQAHEQRALERAERRAREHGYVVYYIRLGRNHIKIGTTNRLPRRMTELRVVNPTNLLAAEPGGYTVERQRHHQFRKWRYDRRKEDFAEALELLKHIRKIRDIHGDPYTLAEARLAETEEPQ